MRRSLLALLLAACGASTPAAGAPSSSTTADPDLPRSAGLALYPVPSEEAPPEVRALLDGLASALAHRLAPPADDSLEGVRAWADETLGSYLREHLQQVRALEERATELARRDDADAVVAAIVVAVAYDDFYRALDGIPLPVEIREDEELTAIFRDALLRAAYPLARRAADAYGWCSQRSARLPDAMRGWIARCEERAAVLGAIEAPPERPRRPAQPAVAWPSECASAEEHALPPEAPPPDPARPEVIAIVTEEEMDADDRTRLLDAVRARVDARLDTPVIPTRDVIEAERLRDQRRVRRRGPVCGQPPPLAWVLADRRPNLVIGQLFRDCIEGDDGDACELRVVFRRAGTDARDGLPGVLTAPITGDPTAIEAWLSAASELAPERAGSSGVLGVLRAQAPVELRVRDDADEDPWLRLRSLLGERTEALAACLPEGVASFSASFDVSAAGDPSAVVVQPRTGGSADAAACVQRALEQARWPCAPEARPRRVEITLCLGRRPEG